MKIKASISLLVGIMLLFAVNFSSTPAEVSAQSRAKTSNPETQDLASLAASVPGVRFVHTATVGNSSGNSTFIDHPLTNEKPNAIVLVTQNWNPGGIGGTYNDHPIGVWYSNFTKKWAIFNQDLASMPVDAAFNVLIPATSTDVFVHTATVGNSSFNYTYIDHTRTNNNPNAIVLVTQNWNPGGVGNTYNDHPIGVWYDSFENKWAIFNQDIVNMPVDAAFNVLIPPDDSDLFVHTATATNLSSQSTFIDHPLTNGNPNAIVLVTQNWNPGGVGGIYNNHAIGVWYSNSAKKWAIFNEDTVNMPDGAAFNVLIPATDTDAFVHTATVGNTGGNSTFIDHPLTNEKPNAIVLVTQNWNPGGVGDTYNDHPIGVWYSNLAKKWAIFNQDLASMPVDASFNVLVPSVDTSVFVHFGRISNTSSNSTFIDHPLTNENPNAIVLITQNWNPSGVGNTYNDHPIGVWYSTFEKKWAIFNQDLAGMPINAAFNVMIPKQGSNVFVHTATAGNTVLNWTNIDHPLTNVNPGAIILTTQNWNPGGIGGTYNNHPIGVWYDGFEDKWAVFNQDTIAMPLSSAYNVLVIIPKVYLPLILK